MRHLQNEYNTPKFVIIGVFVWNRGDILWVLIADSDLTKGIRKVFFLNCTFFQEQ